MSADETQAERRDVKVPFQGFYNTIHDAAFDMALEQINLDDDGEEHEVIGLHNVDWAAVRLAYAQKYLEAAGTQMGMSFTFTRIIEQKDYANGNDMIIAGVERSALENLHQTITSDMEMATAWAQHVRAELTERDGFIPYYSNDASDWGDLTSWDDAQIDCMLDFFAAKVELDEQAIAMELLEFVDEKIWSAVIDPDQVPGHVDNRSEQPDI